MRLLIEIASKLIYMRLWFYSVANFEYLSAKNGDRCRNEGWMLTIFKTLFKKTNLIELEILSVCYQLSYFKTLKNYSYPTSH